MCILSISGEGSHSQVFMAVERATGRQVAVKAVHTDWLDRRRLEFLRAEIEIHQQVSVHPFIVRLLGVYDDPEACYIVEELAEGGSLLAHLHTRSTMGTEDEVCILLKAALSKKIRRKRFFCYCSVRSYVPYIYMIALTQLASDDAL